MLQPLTSFINLCTLFLITIFMKIKFKASRAPECTNKIDCAQGFNVLKISEHEALIARQSIKMCPANSFKTALSIAGLTYDDRKILFNNEEYHGYVAIFIRVSEILIAKLDGSMYIKSHGNNMSYSKIAIDGTLYWVDDIGAKLRKGLQDEKISRPLFEKAICALKTDSEFSVTKTEMKLLAKICCPDYIQITGNV